jgi:hypothetical protein
VIVASFERWNITGFADPEVASRLGLRVAGVEEGAKVGVGDFGARHVGTFP